MFGLVEQFGFSAVWSPLFLMFSLFIATLYLWLVGPGRDRFKDSEPVKLIQKVSFLFGLFLVYLSHGGPLDLLAHLTFTGHMIGMSVVYMVAPPFLILGLPVWFLRAFFNLKWIKKGTFILHPIFTVLFFNAAFSIYHIPMVHDFVMIHYNVHTAYYILLFVAAMMMWWPIVCPVPEMDKIWGVKKMGYIFLNGALLTPACALIIFSRTPLYGSFNDPLIWAQALGYCFPASSSEILNLFTGPQAFAFTKPAEDQQLGGVIMKLIQEFMYGGFLLYTFRQWYDKEKRNDPEKEKMDRLLNKHGQRV
ncbi:cytochrome c oxidase assembly factor CtaG [Chengkuizengella sediminis]|uniref:cytochrome c oxidase assembly factor CtaG n=1 Tax=Chengkuizengella sediminis TaxID=1885917 RepID=UPI00138A5DBA|nr:cytochrome c oxidase assembly factor CtaG [Chengkuizengella sediminis]NDI35255.1 cytochrome c oxidase assembly factor CtaG [Chengkuizengella sediminis]